MNLRHLKFFVMLTDDLNFSRAAERLHVAQPALSRQISLLEQRLGAQLFDRSVRPLRLTEAGVLFFQPPHLLQRLLPPLLQRPLDKPILRFGRLILPAQLRPTDSPSK